MCKTLLCLRVLLFSFDVLRSQATKRAAKRAAKRERIGYKEMIAEFVYNHRKSECVCGLLYPSQSTTYRPVAAILSLSFFLCDIWTGLTLFCFSFSPFSSPCRLFFELPCPPVNNNPCRCMTGITSRSSR
ncbi:hypothetical protein F4861DRAFT_368818 [Xylaria intraflava]|nr:hypothetical protein F4861DRAFT_368818 [Xylaria intraflava]